MDKVVLIGNGFDLAHGLKTSYLNFLIWYINTAIEKYNRDPTNIYADELFQIKIKGFAIPPISGLNDIHRRNEFDLTSTFFKETVNQFNHKNWVDIEYQYYSELIKIFKLFEKQNVERNQILEGRISELNKSFEFMRNRLIEYLNQLDYDKIQPFEQIIEHLTKEHEFIGNTSKRSNKIIYLVFNYTKTLEIYRNYISPENDKIIYIHGELTNDNNPIIFGYGDESDIYYEKFERLNLNEFTKNFKSFKYLKTRNYNNLFNLITNPYEAIIMGHSCGISDRVLLKEIFNPQRCRLIKPYYYKRSDGTTDFEEKTQEISRHFSADLKHTMRLRIINNGALLSR